MAKWTDCERCDLSGQRRRIVLYKGRIPCHVLFVGEAPGESEDVLGVPFIGPAGKLLEGCVEMAFAGRDYLTRGYTNLVACFPREAKDAGVNEPPVEAIKECSARLREVIEIAKPQLIVCVGSLASKWVRKLGNNVNVFNEFEGVKVIDVLHPAFILRLPISHKDLKVQETIVRLQTAVEELVPF